MESEFLTDKENNLPPLPLKTYQWEDLRRAREAGGYPWTHFLKPPLEGEITAEDIIRETTPRRSMSREFSKSRTHSPSDEEPLRILNLDSSPGSSRRHDEEGKDEGVHIPNFSKEISLDSEDEPCISTIGTNMTKRPESQMSHLSKPVEVPKNVSPKGILKRRAHDQQYNIGVTETREKTKCCHTLVNKIKYLADKTLHKSDKNDSEKSPLSKRKKNEDVQEIRQLKSSPGAVRRQKFSAIKLGDSDDMSKTMSLDMTSSVKKENIYEDIEEPQQNNEKLTELEWDVKESDNIIENKSLSSLDPSLVLDENLSDTPNENIMNKLHKNIETKLKNNNVIDVNINDSNNGESISEQLGENRKGDESPNITITEITDDSTENNIEQSKTVPIESSPSPSPREYQQDLNKMETGDNEWSKPSSLVMSKLRRWTSEGGTPIEKPLQPTREGSVQLFTPEVRCACQYFQCDSLLPERVNPVGTRPTSRASNIITNLSDHEYEIIEKPQPNIVYTAPSIEERSKMVKTDEELSSTTSLERKYLQHTSDEEEQTDDKENDENNEDILNAQTLQKNIEERFFGNTPSTPSRTECEISTSQVDSSALENLPLQRSSRPKKNDNSDNKMQQRIKEGTGKLRSQAGKLKSKLQNMKTKSFSMPERPKFTLPDRPKFKMPARPKISLPERPKFTLPDRKKFSFTEKTKTGERKRFNFADRPKFNVPDLSKIKMPERVKINFPSLTKKKNYKDDSTFTESSSDKLQNVASVDFEAKTYPRFFSKKKKTQLPKTSSSPSIHRDDTPPPTFTFTRVKNSKKYLAPDIPDSPEQPREYGDVNNENAYENGLEGKKQFETTYDFDKISPEYLDEDVESSEINETRNAASISDISKHEYTHINEINNDEFFVRPRGISHENIQVREYLSDEIRQAFKIPPNILGTMSDSSEIKNDQVYTLEQDPESELMMDEKEPIQYSTEDINERDDGYYTFPPVRPSRAKRKKKETESIKYIDDSVNASMQFSEVDLGLPDDQVEDYQLQDENVSFYRPELISHTDLRSIHEYANDDVKYPDDISPISTQILPVPPKRRRKLSKKDHKHSSVNDFKNIIPTDQWKEKQEHDDIIVYRTEHEYVVPQIDSTRTDHSPVPPRRNRSRSSRGTSLCDDDRTSHGAESLTLDVHVPPAGDTKIEREMRQESPGYATVDKGLYEPDRGTRRSKSKTPPVRQRKSNSSERKYYTVGSSKPTPDRPPRKKSSTSLMTLDSFTKRSISEDKTQYVEIDEPELEETHKDLVSGEVVKKMKDRPLPPPPRPPRGPKRKKKFDDETAEKFSSDIIAPSSYLPRETSESMKADDVVEIEVSTQTDPLPDDVDFELGLDENLDLSMSSSLRDIIDEESMMGRYRRKVSESPRISRTTSRSEKSLKLSDPKISELSKSNIDRSSPTVILVEKRVSSPTKINEREEMLTEATLTVQHIDIEESLLPEVPPLPKSKISTPTTEYRNVISPTPERVVEKVSEEFTRDVQIDNLVTQRLQVKDLDVGKLNVSELQATKILVSDIEGMTLQVNELDSKSGHISVSGIEFSQSVIDEIVRKFAEISTNTSTVASRTQGDLEVPRTLSREEHTQTEVESELMKTDLKTGDTIVISEVQSEPPAPPPRPINVDDSPIPPQRPPPPDLSPLLLSYFHDLNIPTTTLYPIPNRERLFGELQEPQHQTPQPPTRRTKRKPAAHRSSESSSDGGRLRPSPRRMPPVKPHEPTVTETGAQFLRACHSSITRTITNLYNSFMSYIRGYEDKKEVQTALVIFLVLIAGIIIYGLSDSRAIHHHHWEFFNPPDGNQ